MIETLKGFVELAPERVTVAQARRAQRVTAIPAELRPADELLTRYGLWAQDRYQKRRCASAEGRYQPPPLRDQDDEPVRPSMPDWLALQVQHALVVVPMQYRRVLQAHYIPQREHPMAARRRHRITASTWDASRIEGLRHFLTVYRLRYESARATVPPLLRYTV